MEAPLLLPISTTTPAAASSRIDILTAAADSTSTTPSRRPHSPASSSTSSSSSFVLRLAFLITVACASLLAHHEAGKGFAVAVINDAPARGSRSTASAAARRFDLLFVSNGRAERSLLRASRAVERALFPDPSFPRRPVRRVTLRLAAGTTNLTSVSVAGGYSGEFVLSLSPDLVASSSRSSGSAADEVAAALRRAVARVWLWDGRGAAPASVTEAMVEYLAGAGGDGVAAAAVAEEGCGSSRMWTAAAVRRMEARREGFVARLNRAMKDRWSDAAVDAALGSPATARLVVACEQQLAGKKTTTGQDDDDDDPTAAAATSDAAAARGSSVAM